MYIFSLVGNWVNDTGNIIIRYLPAIYPHEAQSRQEMSHLLRKRMLISIMNDTNEQLLCPLSWSQWCLHYSAIGLLFIIDYYIVLYSHYYFFTYLKLTVSQVCIYISVITMLITALLYIYYVYIVGHGGSGGSGNKKKELKQQ